MRLLILAWLRQAEPKGRGRERRRGRLRKEASKQEKPHSKNHLITYILLICDRLAMEPLFDYEKLDVYRVELAFMAWIADFLGDVAQSSVQYRRELIEPPLPQSFSSSSSFSSSTSLHQQRLEPSLTLLLSRTCNAQGRRLAGKRLWTCCAGTRIRSEALHRMLTIGRPAADRAGARPLHRHRLIKSSNPPASLPKRSLYDRAAAITIRDMQS